MSFEGIDWYRFKCDAEHCSRKTGIYPGNDAREAGRLATVAEAWDIKLPGDFTGSYEVRLKDVKALCPHHAGNPAGDDVESQATELGWQQSEVAGL